MTKKISKEEILQVVTNPESITTPEGAPDFPSEDIASGKVKVEFAAQLHVDDLKEEVAIVLKALGFSTAWVTDGSMIGDFPLDEEDAKEISVQLGVSVSLNDYIYQVAQRVKDCE